MSEESPGESAVERTPPEILRGFVAGDIAAFEMLFRQYQRDVYRWCARLVRDHAAAEDLTIETFWRIYRSRARFDPTRSFAAWARRIATNLALDHLKRTARHREAPEIDVADGADHFARRDTRRTIVRAFHRLPPVLQITATLALVDQCPYQDIAETLGISIGAVKSRVFRATRLLRRELARLGYTP